jgi:tetratricopeptide (TPR) repeat protein
MNQAQAEAAYQKALQLHLGGKLQEAEKLYRDILQHHPRLDIVHANLSAALVASDRPEDALRHAEEALSINPGNREGHINKGAALSALKRIDEAIEVYRFLTLLDPQNGQHHFNLGLAIQRTQGLHAAIPHYQKATRMSPDMAEAWLNLGHAFARVGENHRAIEALRRAIVLMPGHADVLSNLGNLYADEGYLEEAMKSYDEAIEQNPGHIGALLNRARLLTATGDTQQALEDLVAAEAIQPDNAILWCLRGSALFELNRREKALAAYERAHELDPRIPGIYDQIQRMRSEAFPSWHFTMLEDHARNEAFSRAIDRAVRPGMHVLDIGTGTGLLSMMAVRAGADCVTTVEANKEMAQIARRVIAQNGFEDDIQVYNIHSSHLKVGKELPRPVDVIVAEIVDAALLGEGVLPSLRHARACLAVDKPIMIPQGARVYGALVNFTRREFTNVEGFDLSVLNEYRRPGRMANIFGGNGNHRLLSKPFLLESFDFQNIPPAISDEDPHFWEIYPVAFDRGELNGVLLWFELQMDPGEYLSSSPEGELRHWGQVAYWLDGTRKVHEGEEIGIRVGRSDKRWWFGYL